MPNGITPEQARAELERRRNLQTQTITPEMARAELERRQQPTQFIPESPLSLQQRGILSLATPQGRLQQLQKWYPEGVTEIPTKKTFIGQPAYAVKTEKGWQEIDPSRFELGGDIADIVSELIRGGGMGLGAAKGAIAGMAGGPLAPLTSPGGAVIGATLGRGLGSQAVQALGRQFDVRPEETVMGGLKETGQEAVSGAMGQMIGMSIPAGYNQVIKPLVKKYGKPIAFNILKATTQRSEGAINWMLDKGSKVFNFKKYGIQYPMQLVKNTLKKLENKLGNISQYYDDAIENIRKAENIFISNYLDDAENLMAEHRILMPNPMGKPIDILDETARPVPLSTTKQALLEEYRRLAQLRDSGQDVSYDILKQIKNRIWDITKGRNISPSDKSIAVALKDGINLAIGQSSPEGSYLRQQFITFSNAKKVEKLANGYLKQRLPTGELSASPQKIIGLFKSDPAGKVFLEQQLQGIDDFVGGGFLDELKNYLTTNEMKEILRMGSFGPWGAGFLGYKYGGVPGMIAAETIMSPRGMAGLTQLGGGIHRLGTMAYPYTKPTIPPSISALLRKKK